MLKDDVERFVRDGFFAVRGAVRQGTVAACRDVLWDALRKEGVHPDDRNTWTKPVIRLDCPEGGPFAEAGSEPVLWDVYDALLAPNRWTRRRGVGGTVPVRFPSEVDPGDAGWHIDGSYGANGDWWVNLRSKGRGLLALFLFTDTGEEGAPTRILVGSHLDVPSVLAPAGDTGMPFGHVAPKLQARTFERSQVRATGRAGDVFVCHPFLVHAASWPHRGTSARMIAQPEVSIEAPFRLSDIPSPCPVEQAILRGLLSS
jgi:hypothetical protein